MTVWSEWQSETAIFADRYVQWWAATNPEWELFKEWNFQIAPSSVISFSQLQQDAQNFSENGQEFQESGKGTRALQKVVAEGKAEPFSIFPVPIFSNNPKFFNYISDPDLVKSQAWLPPDLAVPKPGKAKAVLGIIDLGIALGHRRFRDLHGRTRVLASWQQGAAFAQQEYLPFGEVLMQGDINRKLAANSGGDLPNPLDEAAFNIDAGLVNMAERFGTRDLLRRVAHGTHVLDVAGGADPKEIHDSFGEDVSILAVNLPAMVAFGEGGGFLDYYLIYALRWMIETYARIHEKTDKEGRPPLIINTSLGKFAGSRDRSQDFVGELIASAAAGRGQGADGQNLPDEVIIVGDAARDEPIKGVELNAFLPAGNDNLAQANLRATLAPKGKRGEATEVLWRIRPNDKTSNIIEIWTKEEQPVAGDCPPIAIDVIPPGSPPVDAVLGSNGEHRNLICGIGRIWLDRFDTKTSLKDALTVTAWRHLIALTPSDYIERPDVKTDGAMAGAWTLRIQNMTDRKIYVSAAIQSDQVALPNQPPPLRSSFDHPDYRKYDDTGRLMDSFSYAPTLTDQDEPGPVRRRGTLNSYAANTAVSAIGGYRLSDGRPAHYSATGLGHPDVFEIPITLEERRAPTASFVSDDGAAHAGVLASGSADGSTVALDGTSVACAAAVRFVLEQISEGRRPPHSKKGPLGWQYVRHAAETAEPSVEWPVDFKTKLTKRGAGLVLPSDAHRKRRFGR